MTLAEIRDDALETHILANPTSENVAQLIAATLRLPGLSAVEVSETGTSGVRLAL